jgi:hypothetical protein
VDYPLGDIRTDMKWMRISYLINGATQILQYLHPWISIDIPTCAFLADLMEAFSQLKLLLI